MLSLPWATWERLIIWMAIGVAFYFVYGYRQSVLRTPPQETHRRSHDDTTHPSLCSLQDTGRLSPSNR